jgi:hypothetical protein
MESFDSFLTSTLLLTKEDEAYKAFMKYYILYNYIDVSKEIKERNIASLYAVTDFVNVELHVIKLSKTEIKNALCRVAEYLLDYGELIKSPEDVITLIFRDVFNIPGRTLKDVPKAQFKDILTPCGPSFVWDDIIEKMGESLNFQDWSIDLIIKKSYKDQYKKDMIASLKEKVRYLHNEGSHELQPTSDKDKETHEVKIMIIINKIFLDKISELFKKAQEYLKKNNVSLEPKYHLVLPFLVFYSKTKGPKPIQNTWNSIYADKKVSNHIKKEIRAKYDANPKKAVSTYKVYSFPDNAQEKIDEYLKNVKELENEKNAILKIPNILSKGVMGEIEKKIVSIKDEVSDLHNEIEEMEGVVLSLESSSSPKITSEHENHLKELKKNIDENKKKIVRLENILDTNVASCKDKATGVSLEKFTLKIKNCIDEKAHLEKELERLDSDHALVDWTPEEDWFIRKRLDIVKEYCHEGKRRENMLQLSVWVEKTDNEIKKLLESCQPDEESITRGSQKITEIKKQQAERRAQAKSVQQKDSALQQPATAAKPVDVVTPSRPSKKGDSLKSAAAAAVVPSAPSAPAAAAAVVPSAPAAAAVGAAAAFSSKKSKKSISKNSPGHGVNAEERLKSEAEAKKKAENERQKAQAEAERKAAYDIAKANDEKLRKQFEENKNSYKSHKGQLRVYVDDVKKPENNIEYRIEAQKNARDTYELMEQKCKEMLNIIASRAAIVTPDGKKIVQPEHLDESRNSVEKMLQFLHENYDDELNKNDKLISEFTLGAVKGKSPNAPKILVRKHSVVGATARDFVPGQGQSVNAARLLGEDRLPVVGARAQDFVPGQGRSVDAPRLLGEDRRPVVGARAQDFVPGLLDDAVNESLNVDAPVFTFNPDTPKPVTSEPLTFGDIFTCTEEIMKHKADVVKAMTDEEILQTLQSHADMARYMTFNTHISRMLYAAGIIGPLLTKRFDLVLVGKTALQLNAVFNHVAIENLYRGKIVDRPRDDAHSSMIFLHKPLSDCDFMVLSDQLSESNIVQLKNIIKTTFSLFFSQEMRNYSESQIPPDEWTRFRITPGAMITKQSFGSENTLKYLKSVEGRGVEIADFTFGKTREDFEKFKIDPPSIEGENSVFRVTISDLRFTVATHMRLLCEYIFIIITELNKLALNDHLFKQDLSDSSSSTEFFFKFMTTFTKFISRIAQLACIEYSIHKHNNPRFEVNIINGMILFIFENILKRIIKSTTKFRNRKKITNAFTDIITLFFIYDRSSPNVFLVLNEGMIKDIVQYKETRPLDYKTREGNVSVKSIVAILIRYKFITEEFLPPPNMMGGIPLSKTKRMIQRKSKYRKVKTYKQTNRNAYNKNRKTHRKKQIKKYSRKGRK